jgi:DNA-binding MarR family transcriptional regulator/GNAT superfamily N-acetyltransferase
VVTSRELEQTTAAVRRFNRFYTRRIGVLEEGHLRSPFSLAEARVLYELAHRNAPAASDLARELELDPGYLSRIVRRLERRGLIDRRAAEDDGRRTLLTLTPRGRDTFATLDARASEHVAGMLGHLTPSDRRRLAGAMRAIEHLLGEHPEPTPPYLLRPPQPGDLGWVVHRHGVLYAHEYGWNQEFEALVARIVADFVAHYDPKRERCWIAERDGEIVGSVFLVKQAKTIAKLRLLYVEPEARGLGIGSRLVRECIRFARQAGYRKITLWTNSVLLAARRIYERAGFRLVHEEPHHSFGHDLVSETWELVL